MRGEGGRALLFAVVLVERVKRGCIALAKSLRRLGIWGPPLGRGLLLTARLDFGVYCLTEPLDFVV